MGVATGTLDMEEIAAVQHRLSLSFLGYGPNLIQLAQ